MKKGQYEQNRITTLDFAVFIVCVSFSVDFDFGLESVNHFGEVHSCALIPSVQCPLTHVDTRLRKTSNSKPQPKKETHLIETLSSILIEKRFMTDWFQEIVQHQAGGRDDRTLFVRGVMGKVGCLWRSVIIDSYCK